MRPTRRFALAAVSLATFAALGASGAYNSIGATDPRSIEVRRIQAHFDSVLVELAAPASAPVDAERAGHRLALLRTLREYRDRAVFPHNYDFPGRAVPYFVDRQTGTLCAVANLLAHTGRGDIVARVARTDNNVRVAQLAGDTAFMRWLDANGLTLAEAARIQVPYVDGPRTAAERSRNTAFLVVTPLAVGGSIASSLWNASANADGHRRAGNVIGLVSGMFSIAVSAVSAGKSQVPAAATAAGAGIGGLSIGLATRSMLRQRELAGAKRAEEHTRVSVAPIVPAGGGAGMSVALRF